MKVFIIGGTGLLGSEAARVLIERGHSVTSVALPPLPEGAVLPPEMTIEYGSYLEMSDEALRARMAGCDGFVFAAGVDERVEGPVPVYDLYKKYNIDPIKRLLKLAKECGVRHAAVCGSYFAYFAKTMPALELTRWHPYIRSRIEQEDAALALADDEFSVGILELPYIFGTQPGRKPVWLFIAELIRNARDHVLYPRGGSAMVTARQAGQALAGALEHTRGGQCWPIGYDNLTWKQMLAIMCKHMGCADKKVTTIPDWLFTMGCKAMFRQQKKQGIQGGLYLPKLVGLQCSELFIDKALGCEPLGVEPDDIDAAIGESMRLCVAILDGRIRAIGMKGE